MLLWGSAPSVRYRVYKLYIMYINWDVSLCKLMVYSLQIKLSPLVLEIDSSTSSMPGASLTSPMSFRKNRGTHCI